MFKRILLSIWMLMIGFAVSYGQTTVIGPGTLNGDFEDATNTAWTFVNGTETNQWVISTGANTGFSGSKAAYVSNSTSSPYAHSYSNSNTSVVYMYQDVTLPAAQPVVNLSFKRIVVGEGSNWDKLAVYISNGATPTALTAGSPSGSTSATLSPSGYTLIGGPYDLISNWTTINVPITQAQAGNATASSTRRIVFLWSNDGSGGSNPPAGVDDVLLTAACSGPIGLNATAITTNSATLNWTALTGATGYNIRYKKVSDPATVTTWATPTTVGAGVTSLPITGLTALSTQYEFQVSANGPVCNNYNASATFATVCGYATLPYSETFESITADNQLPFCMASTGLGNYYTSGNFNTWASVPSYPSYGANHTPGGSKFAAPSYGGHSATIFTPGIVVQAGKMYQFKFWYKLGGTPANMDSIVVSYGTAQTTAGMTNNVATIIPSSANGSNYVQSVTNFVATANASVFFGIKYASNYNNYDLNSLDDIEIIELPPCTGRPVAGTVTPDPANPCIGKTARLGLTGGSQASGLSYQWQQYNFVTATWSNIGSATGNNYTTPTLLDSLKYRAIVTCTNAGGSADTTPVYTLNPYTLQLPYLETFEGITSNDELPSCWAATVFGNQTHTYIGTPPYPSDGGQNHTPGGNNYATFFYYYPDNWFFTPAVKLDTGKTYMLKLWHVTGSGLTWNLLRAAYGTAQVPGAMLNPILAKTNINNTIYQQAKGKFNVGAPGLYNVGITVEPAGYPYGHFSIDDINLIELPPCSGQPTIAMGQADTISICPDTTASTMLTGTAGDFSGYAYQWDSSTNGTTWFPIPGEITEEHEAFSSAAYPKVYFRLRVTCIASGMSDTGITVLNIKSPDYAALPYFNGFENWDNSCAVTDVPDGGNWKQYWYTGNASWRRNDQGASANWSNDYGAYYPDAQSGSYSARFNSASALANTPPYGYGEAQLDMYLDCSANTGSKGLYFYYINQDNYGSANDSLTLWYSVDGGLVFTQIGGWDQTNADDWSRRVINIPSNSPATIISFRARNALGYENTDIGIDSVYVANPCTGTPTAGNIALTGSAAVCAGSTPLLNLTGTSMAGNILVQWESSTTSSTTGFVPVSTAGTQYGFNTPPVSTNTWFRAKVTCGTSGLFDYSNVIAVTTTTVAYAALPFIENFESWSSRCSTSDIPSANWTNNPATGDKSWRRNDQGTTANWIGATSGGFFPAAAVGNYSARFHNYYEQSSGKLDLYVNCSGAGNKELRYYLNMGGRSPYYTNEYIRVSYSMDGGASFSIIGNFTSTVGWEQKKHVMPSPSPTTIVRFESFGNTYYQDIGIDYVEVLPACTGQPVAGTIDPVSPCSGSTFLLKTTGTSPAGGLTYQWQSTTAATPAGFTNVAAGGTNPTYNASVTQPTWFRLVVTCPGSSMSDTSAPFQALLNTFYNCYCSALPYYPYQYNTTLQENIGSVKLSTQPANTLLISTGSGTPLTNNTTSTNPNNPGYTSYTNLPPAPVYHDSTYKLTVQEVSAYSYNNGGSVVAAWIDYNQDGTFDQNTERVVLTSTSYSDYRANANFTIPATAKVGVTAMRVILAYNYGTLTPPTVCGIYNNYGETEDYLVEIRYTPCSGPVNAGIATASDLNTCPGYKLTLTDTSYEKKRYGLIRTWQQSTNGGSSYTNIAGSQGRDTFKTLVAGPTKYRFALTCSVTGEVSYSNVLDVKMNEPYQCYCASYADGGTSEKADSSDVGSFSIGNYTFQVGGPHLQNPAATRERTDYTEDNANTLELWADSTYKIDIYHIMKGRLHKDAKVTLFLDYNNDFQYSTSPAGSNYPSERVLTAFTSASDYYLDNLTITIPKGYIIPNKLTGMRLILNENTAANNASDEGCGVYTSGETEDFAVIFRDPSAPTGVNGVTGNVKVLSLYPNPTSGAATLSYSSDVFVKDLELTITSATGQVISKQKFPNAGKSFTTEVNLADQARGIYFVEIKADGERIIRKLVTQ